MSRRPSTNSELDLFEALWHDRRRRDDRSEFFECDACGRAIRWIANLRSEHRSSLQIVARPVTTPAFFDPERHRGLVAVYADRTGFTVSRFTTADDLEDTFLYACHWDVCDHARTMRDRLSRERRGELLDLPTESDPITVLRYEQWRRGQEEQ